MADLIEPITPAANAEEIGINLRFYVNLATILTGAIFCGWSLYRLHLYRLFSILITPNEPKAGKIFKIHIFAIILFACFNLLELTWAAIFDKNTGWSYKTTLLSYIFQALTWICVTLLIQVETKSKFSMESIKNQHHFFIRGICSTMFIFELFNIVDKFLQENLIIMSWTFGHLIFRLICTEIVLLVSLYAPGLPKPVEIKNEDDENEDEKEKQFVSKLTLWTKIKMLKPFAWPDENYAKCCTVICLMTLAIDRFLTLYTNIYNKKVVDSMDFNLLDSGSSTSNSTVTPDEGLLSPKENTAGLHIEFRWDYVALSVLLKSLSYGLELVRSISQLKIRNITSRGIQVRLFDKLHSLSLRWHLERRTGSILYQLQNPLGNVAWQLEYFVTDVLMSWSDMIVSLIYIASSYNEQITILLIITMICSLALDIIFHNWDRQFQYWSRQLESRKLDKAIDSIMSFETVKYFSNERYETKRFKDACQAQESAEKKQYYAIEFMYLIRNLMEDFGLLGAKLICLWMVFKNRGISPGDYVFLSTTLQQFTNPISRILSSYSSFMTDMDQLEELYEVLDLEPEIQDEADAPELIISSGGIEMRNVSFQYLEEKPILKDINFKVEGGKTLAIVGPSGSGKSTLIKLIFRFYDPNSGEILVDGQDIKKVQQHSLRKTIGVVPQDTILFNDTIVNNILYGKVEDGKMEDVIQACKHACIHDKIETFAEGYNTKVAERGLKLSGGEKQRVGIARMLLKDPKIFLLDEATSSLDTTTERLIQQSLKNACKNRTSIIIAHRLSTIVNADQIIVLKDGQIVETGKHAELLKLKGEYANMWQEQIQSELKATEDGDGNTEQIKSTEA